jgi:hypothetical protein
MAGRALPPRLLAGSGGHVFGPEVAVAVRMPLRGEVGSECGEGAFGCGSSPGAVGTPRAAAAVEYRCRPVVALGASPPDTLTRARRNLVWFQGAILRRVPLCGKVGVNGCQVTNAGGASP